MSTPHPLEEETQLYQDNLFDPWKNPRPAGMFAGFFSEDNAYLSPIVSGAGQGAALIEQGLGTLVRGAGRLYMSVGKPRVVGAELPAVGGSIEDDARERVKALTPSSATTGAATQIVSGLASGAYRMTAGALLAGPAGGATLIGTTAGRQRYLELREQGVDERTAATLGGFAAVANAAGAVMPAGIGANLLTRLGSGMAGNMGFGMMTRAVDHDTLEEAGFHEMANQQRVWDGQAVLADLLLGGAFGAVAHLQARGEAKAKAQETLRLLEERLGRGAPGAEDAALALSLASRDDAAAPGVAVNPAAMTAHAAALEQAQVDLERGRPVNVAGTGVEDSTFAKREAPQLGEAQTMLLRALQDGGFGQERDELARLEAAMGARLAGEKPEEQPTTPTLEPRMTGESDEAYTERAKAFAKKYIDTGPLPDTANMSKDWRPYFQEDGDAIVPVSSLDFGAEPEAGRDQNALKRMAAAAGGGFPRRGPLTVDIGQDGRIKVMDGKSTLGALRTLGIEQVPVRFAEQPGAPELRVLPVDTAKALQRQYLGANQAQGAFKDLVDRLASSVGAKAVVAPLKGLRRAAEKVRDEYGGDAGKLKDILRATLVVDSAADAREAVRAIQDAGALPTNQRNFFDESVPPPADGYRDAKLNVRMPNGVVAEIQVHLSAMHNAKEATGHQLYEQRRPLDVKSVLTPEETHQFQELNGKMRELYEPIWEAATSRSKSSAEAGMPLRSTEPTGNGLGGVESNALAARPPSEVGPSATGTPSTLWSDVPGGNARTGLPGTEEGGAALRPALEAPFTPRTVAQSETHEVMTAAGRKITVRPKVVEASELVTSDQERYPKELQPRQRGARAALTEQVSAIARNLNPEMLGNAPEADRGAPIVGPGNVVESGNGRVFALRKAYEEQTGEVEGATKTKADMRREFIGRDDNFWGIETQELGGGEQQSKFRGSEYSGVQCTGYACAILHKLGEARVKVFGFSEEDNPTSAIAQDAGGHDFAVVDGRYIVDPWLPEFGPGKESGVYDLKNARDKAKVEELYGDQAKWKDMTGQMPAAPRAPGAAGYRQWLAEQGYDVAGMKQPVLVRERVSELTEGQRRAFTVEANQTSVAALSPVERAAADSRLLDSAVLSQLRNGEIASAQNAPFVRAFLQRVPEGERNALVNPDGTVSQEGVRRLQAAILGKAYGGSLESNAVLGRMLESTDADMRSTMGALLDAAPAFAKLRQAVEDGKVGPEYDLSKALTQAIETTARVRESGQALPEFLKQEDFLTRRLPIVDQLMRSMYDKSGERLAGREKVAQTLMNYADRAIKQRLDQGMLFGDRPSSPEQLLEPPREPERPEMRPSADMFGLRRAPTQTADQVARQVLESSPNLEVPAANGELVRARAELIAAEEGAEKLEERAPEALSIAANCFGQKAA